MLAVLTIWLAPPHICDAHRRVDGNDAAAVFAATRDARALAVSEGTPVVLELMTYRVGDHTTSDDSSAYRGESSAEVAALVSAGPITRLRKHLELSPEGWSAAEEAAAKAGARSDMVAAIEAGEGKRRPPMGELFTDVYAEPPWHLQRQRRMLEGEELSFTVAHRANPSPNTFWTRSPNIFDTI